MGAVTPYTKVKSPNDPSLARIKAYEERTGKKYMGFSSPFAEDRVDDLARARLGYTNATGRKDLKDVTTTEAYKNFTSSQKQEYRKRNPKDFLSNLSEVTLSKKTLLGGN
jgi:hypothetical protein